MAGADEPEGQERTGGGNTSGALEWIEDKHEDLVVTGPTPGWLRPLLGYQRAVDWVSELFGRLALYFVVAVVLVGFGNAVLRYVGRATGQQLASNRYIELQWYLYATMFLLTFAYILKNGINVRVDFWYGDRSRKTKAWIDFVGHLFALIPFCLLALWVSWGPILTSWGARPDGSFPTAQVWRIWERSPDPGGLPRAPIKTMLWLGFALLLLQALAEMVKLVAELTGHGRLVRTVERPAAEVRAQ